MTTADRHTDSDPRSSGGAYRASDVDTTAQDDAARYESVEGTAADGTHGTSHGTTHDTSHDTSHGTTEDTTDSSADDLDDRTRQPGGYARHHDDGTATTGTLVDTGAEHSSAAAHSVDGHTPTQRLDAQDADLRGASDPTPTGAAATDEPRTEGGFPHSADSVDHSGDHAGDHAGLDGHASGRHADSGVRTVDVGSGGTTAAGAASTGSAGSDKLERLVPSDRVDDYTTRWDAVKGEFVDEPRQAVAKADKLVGELLDELDQLFRKQRSDLEHGLDADETSTEDLRLALRRYRSFFDRLLAL